MKKILFALTFLICVAIALAQEPLPEYDPETFDYSTGDVYSIDNWDQLTAEQFDQLYGNPKFSLSSNSLGSSEEFDRIINNPNFDITRLTYDNTKDLVSDSDLDKASFEKLLTKASDEGKFTQSEGVKAMFAASQGLDPANFKVDQGLTGVKIDKAQLGRTYMIDTGKGTSYDFGIETVPGRKIQSLEIDKEGNIKVTYQGKSTTFKAGSGDITRIPESDDKGQPFWVTPSGDHGHTFAVPEDAEEVDVQVKDRLDGISFQEVKITGQGRTYDVAVDMREPRDSIKLFECSMEDDGSLIIDVEDFGKGGSVDDITRSRFVVKSKDPETNIQLFNRQDQIRRDELEGVDDPGAWLPGGFEQFARVNGGAVIAYDSVGDQEELNPVSVDVDGNNLELQGARGSYRVQTSNLDFDSAHYGPVRDGKTFLKDENGDFIIERQTGVATVTTTFTQDSALNIITEFSTDKSGRLDVETAPHVGGMRFDGVTQDFKFDEANGELIEGTLARGGRFTYAQAGVEHSGSLPLQFGADSGVTFHTDEFDFNEDENSAILISQGGALINVQQPGTIKFDEFRIDEGEVDLSVQDEQTEQEIFVMPEEGETPARIDTSGTETDYVKLDCGGSNGVTGRAITGMQVASGGSLCLAPSTTYRNELGTGGNYEQGQRSVEHAVDKLTSGFEEQYKSQTGVTLTTESGRTLSLELDKQFVVGEGRGEKYNLYKYTDRDGGHDYSLYVDEAEAKFVTMYVLQDPKTGKYVELTPLNYNNIINGQTNNGLTYLGNNQLSYAMATIPEPEESDVIFTMPEEPATEPTIISEEQEQENLERSRQELLDILGVTEQRPTELEEIQERVSSVQESAWSAPEISVEGTSVFYSGENSMGFFETSELPVSAEEFEQLPASEQARIVSDVYARQIRDEEGTQRIGYQYLREVGEPFSALDKAHFEIRE